MDSLDIRVIRELSQGRNVGLVWGDVNPAYREIGRKLGVSKETIRDRVAKMRASGFLTPFPVQVNPSLVGTTMGALTVDARDQGAKADALRKLALVDGMLLMVSHVGTMLGLIFFYESERSRSRKVELISRLCSASRVGFTPVPYPPTTIEPSPLDWEIMAALQRKGGSSGDLSSELGVSERTLRRRVDRMIRGWAISRLISMNVRALRGGVVANLVVYYDSHERRAETDRHLITELDEFLFFPGLWTSYSVYSLILPSIPHAAKVLEATRSTKGVRDARIELAEDRIELYERLSEQVDDKLAALRGGPKKSETPTTRRRLGPMAARSQGTGA